MFRQTIALVVYLVRTPAFQVGKPGSIPGEGTTSISYIMYVKNYFDALKHAAELAPSITKPTAFIGWAEDVAQLLAFIYAVDYNEVTEDLVEKAKEVQDDE